MAGSNLLGRAVQARSLQEVSKGRGHTQLAMCSSLTASPAQAPSPGLAAQPCQCPAAAACWAAEGGL